MRLKPVEHKPATSRQVPQDSETNLWSWPLGAIAHAAMFAGSDMASHDVHLLRWAGGVNTFSMGGSVNVLVQRKWNRSTHLKLSAMPKHHIRQKKAANHLIRTHLAGPKFMERTGPKETHTQCVRRTSLDFQELSSTWAVGSYQFPQCSHRPALRCPAHAFEAPGFAAAGTSLHVMWVLQLASCNFIPTYSNSFLQSLQCSTAEPSKVHASSLASESLSAVANLQQSGKADYPWKHRR